MLILRILYHRLNNVFGTQVGTQVYDDEFFKDDRGSFNTWEMDGYKNSEESIADQENNYTRSNPELFSSSMNHNPELSSTRSNPELFSSYMNHNPELSSTRSSNFIEDNPLFDYDEKFSPVNDGYGSSSEENYNFRINNWRKDDFYTTAYLSDSQEELSNNQNNVQINLEGQTTKTSDDLVSQLQENNAFYDNKETHTNINVENPGSQAESELNESGISESQENNESFSDNYTLRENFDNQSLETNSKGGEFDEQKFQEWYLNNQESIQQGIFGNFRNSSSSNYIPRGSSTGEVMVNAEGTSLEHDFDPLSANFEDEIEIENNIDLNINYSTPSASGGGYDIVVTEGEIQPFLTEL
ncbi:hypothetical protein JTY60_01735 [symbiont of Argiope bruennichi]|uniref:hypothetical protein n=1 Tax=symbiont of Argiope bruennichi TaxID=2810479 RepID=UPI003DA38712